MKFPPRMAKVQIDTSQLGIGTTCQLVSSYVCIIALSWFDPA